MQIDELEGRVRALNHELFEERAEHSKAVEALAQAQAKAEQAEHTLSLWREEQRLAADVAAAKDERIASLERERDTAVFQADCLRGDIDELQLRLRKARAASASSQPALPQPSTQGDGSRQGAQSTAQADQKALRAREDKLRAVALGFQAAVAELRADLSAAAEYGAAMAKENKALRESIHVLHSKLSHAKGAS